MLNQQIQRNKFKYKFPFLLTTVVADNAFKIGLQQFKPCLARIMNNVLSSKDVVSAPDHLGTHAARELPTIIQGIPTIFSPDDSIFKANADLHLKLHLTA